MRTCYVVDDFDAFFERAGENVHTVNVWLWNDTIMTRDHRIVQYVLATCFGSFGKGVKVGLGYPQYASINL